MLQLQPHERIWLAFDRSEWTDDDIRFFEAIADSVGGCKLGLETVSAVHEGNSIAVYYRALPVLRHLGIEVFGDWKLKDIKNTVAKSVTNISKHGVWGFTIYADASEGALRAAVRARGNANVIGVTGLTDISPEECEKTYGRDPESQVAFFAEKLVECGVQALVCSPLELATVRKTVGDKLICITPGIRDENTPPDDQKRTMTARDAINAGADYLVIGRPIMESDNPITTAHEFAEKIASAEANLSTL